MTSQSQVKLTALTRKELAALLRKSGSTTVDEESLGNDISNGAPVNEDGTMSLLEYAAWLAKEDPRDGNA